METAQPTIRLATTGDVAGVMALEERHYIGNVDPAKRSGGFISVLHSAEWFGEAIDNGGLHVAVTPHDGVVGFIAVTPPPDPAAVGMPGIVRTMLDLAGTLEFNGVPIARQRYAFRGPVCIAEAARGRGVYSAFNAITGKAYRDRYDLGVLFVSADNPRSLHTTTVKLGARQLAEFDCDGGRFHFLAFAFGAS